MTEPPSSSRHHFELVAVLAGGLAWMVAYATPTVGQHAAVLRQPGLSPLLRQVVGALVRHGDVLVVGLAALAVGAVAVGVTGRPRAPRQGR